MSTPFLAALPTLAITAVGVAKTNAHGQAIKRTAVTLMTAVFRRTSGFVSGMKPNADSPAANAPS